MREKIGEVAHIFISPRQGNLEHPEENRIIELDSVRVVENGFEGDRYSGSGETPGFWQVVDQKLPAEKRKVRDGSGLSLEDLEEENLRNGTNLEPIDTRRNLAFKGISKVQRLIGETLQIGDSVWEIPGDCNSCNRPSKLSGKPGYEKHKEAGGIRMKVKETGEIKKGD